MLIYTSDPAAVNDLETVVSAMCPELSFRCGYPAGDDWVHVLDLIGPDPHVLDACLRRIQAPAAVDIEHAASVLLRSYATALTGVATAAYLATGTVPDVSMQNLAVRIGDHGVVGVALRTGRCVKVAGSCRRADHEGVLRRWLWHRLIDRHIGMLIDVLDRRTGRSASRLWADVVAACAGVFVRFDAVFALSSGAGQGAAIVDARREQASRLAPGAD